MSCSHGTNPPTACPLCYPTGKQRSYEPKCSTCLDRGFVVVEIEGPNDEHEGRYEVMYCVECNGTGKYKDNRDAARGLMRSIGGSVLGEGA
jgi:hypothetical protein